MEAIIIKESDNGNLRLDETVQRILTECDKADAKKYHDNPAKWMCKRLIELINEFEEDIPQNQQAGVQLPLFGNEILQIDGVGYEGTEVLIFCLLSRTRSHVRLVQHITQLNLLLVAVQRTDDLSKPRRKIGFETPVK